MATTLFFFGIFLSILFFSLVAKLAIIGVSETLKNIQSKN